VIWASQTLKSGAQDFYLCSTLELISEVKKPHSLRTSDMQQGLPRTLSYAK